MQQELSTNAIREALIEGAVGFLGKRPTEEIVSFRTRVTDLVAHVSAEELARLAERIQHTGADWGYHPPEPFARSMHWAMADVALAADSKLEGTEHLATVGSGPPVVFLANHLSYADANLFEILLHRSGLDEIADRLTVIAGPKVYGELFRRFSSLCFGTIKTPQSSSRSSGEAVMSARDVARIAQKTISIAEERQRRGEHLLVFLEGTRSRTASMQRALPAVARYFEYPGSRLVPLGITGSESLFPVGDERVHPATVRVRVGAPLGAKQLTDASRGNRRLAVDAVAVRIAELLPPQYRGAYAEPLPDTEEARTVAASL